MTVCVVISTRTGGLRLSVYSGHYLPNEMIDVAMRDPEMNRRWTNEISAPFLSWLAEEHLDWVRLRRSQIIPTFLPMPRPPLTVGLEFEVSQTCIYCTETIRMLTVI